MVARACSIPAEVGASASASRISSKIGPDPLLERGCGEDALDPLAGLAAEVLDLGGPTVDGAAKAACAE